ncbi:MAG: PKD domain-containing protein [Thermoplasmata archaeon]|nr:PKD domain-containing protein [Thermoplasmata archaeon]
MLTVTLALACTSASASGPVADAGPDLVVIEGEEFILDGSNSTDDVGIVLWTWYIEIDDTSAVIIPNETIATVDLYLSPGLHIITLKVHDADDNEDSDTCSVLVMETDLPLADASEDATTEAGEEHTFDGSGTHSKYPIISYTWTFRYDTSDITLQGVEPSFTFRIPGEFLVTLTVVDTNGSSDTDTVTITSEDTTLPVPIIEVTKEESSERRKLDGSGSTDNVAIIKWSWVVVFENEITDLSGETVELHRADPGVYDVTLIVYDSAGNKASDSVTFTIKGEDPDLAFMWLTTIAIASVIVVVVAILTVKQKRTLEPKT